MNNFFSSIAGCIALAGLTSGLVSAALQDKHPKFPPGEGRELTIKVCSGCHDAEVLTDKAQDAEGWRATVNQMAGMGANASEEELELIIKYLAASFPAEK
jgi:mono/diheme cytochrome c family protein